MLGDFQNLPTAINSPVDQTTLLRFSTLVVGDAAAVNQAAFLVQDFLTQAADYLNECLDAGPLQAGIVQGSAYCGAISCTPEGVAERALISPEELTAVMTLKLLEEAPDE